jgi:hypothetical protein
MNYANYANNPSQILSTLFAPMIAENQNLRGKVENLRGKVEILKGEASDLQEEVNGHEVNNARLGEENARLVEERDIQETKLHHAYGIIAQVEGLVKIWVDPEYVKKHKDRIHYETLMGTEQALKRKGISLGHMYVTRADQDNFFKSGENEHLVVYAYIHEPNEDNLAIRILAKLNPYRFSRDRCSMEYVTDFNAKSGRNPKDFKYPVSRCCQCRKSVPECVCDEY